MHIGPTQYSDESVLSNREAYPGGSTALRAINPDNGSPNYTITVSLKQFPIPPLPPHEIWVKTWNENTGVAEALVTAGIIKLTGRMFQVNEWGSTALHAKLTPAACEYLGIKYPKRRQTNDPT